MPENEIEKVKKLIKNTQDLRKKYSESRNEFLKKSKFNPFCLMSDIYHRENFHSDIIKEILNPKGFHGDGKIYLLCFIDYINGICNKNIDYKEYENATVEREDGRVDILISSKKKCIIIESKINVAPNMPRQLPRYLEHTQNLNLECEAIIYLSLNQPKEMSYSGWHKNEIKKIKSLLIPIIAYGGENSLHKGWLESCSKCGSENSSNTIKYYQNLLEYLSMNNTNNPANAEFYKLIIEEEKFESVKLILELLTKMPDFRALKIHEKFKEEHKPFGLCKYEKKLIGLEVYFKGLKTPQGENLKLSIYTGSTEETTVWLWDGEPNKKKKNMAEFVLNAIGADEFEKFKWTDNVGYKAEFSFPSEEVELYYFVELFLDKCLKHFPPYEYA